MHSPHWEDLNWEDLIWEDLNWEDLIWEDLNCVYPILKEDIIYWIHTTNGNNAHIRTHGTDVKVPCAAAHLGRPPIAVWATNTLMCQFVAH